MTITPEIIAKRVRLARRGGLVLALVLGLVFAWARLGAYQNAAHMLATGAHVEATIVQKRQWREEGRRNSENDRYAVTYEFADSSGKTSSKERRVGQAYFSQVNEGDTISVIYDPDQPEINDTREQYERKGSIGNSVRDALVLVVIVILVGYAIGFLIDKKMRRALAARPNSNP